MTGRWIRAQLVSITLTTRTLLIVAVLGAGFGLEAQTSTQGAASVGVLVGIHKRGHDFAPGAPVPASLRTVWLETDDSATRALPRLLVPRSSGFWWVGLTNTCSERRPQTRRSQCGVELSLA